MTRFPPLPNRRFAVILADPPWLFRVRTKAGEGKSPQRHYPCVPDADLMTLDIASVAERNCALFLWATWPKMPSALKLIEAWRFTYKGLGFDWIKYDPRTGKFAFGGGYGTRKNPEPCLLATRGNPQRLSASVRDLIFSPRREHSRKPDDQYAGIEALYPGPYLELFSRSRREGWTSWGNQVGRFG
ncbi:MAG: MT-A70 family methyltransferase [Tagaea sp.]|nr:MT-A70 family methyltransferase [Tagaea sp.]